MPAQGPADRDRSSPDEYLEPARPIPVVRECDVLVCGGGPAGIGAAIAAARTGARTMLVETHGFLGGVWTAGALSRVMEAGQPGIMAELTRALDARGARADSRAAYCYDLEAMKVVLDEMALAAGVDVRLHTRVAGAERDAANRLRLVITESKSGREAWAARAVVDATGDGDVAEFAGCGYDYGHPRTGETQPMSLMALLTGLRLDDVAGFVAGGARPPAGRHAAAAPSNRYVSATASLSGELARAGIEPSYTAPTLWCVYEDLFALMANHQYGVSALNADEISRATMEARIEIDRMVSGLRSLGGVWAGLRLVATGAQLGVREGRRIHGRYHVTAADLVDGRRHQDAVCRVTSPADIHALSAGEGGALSRAAGDLGGVDRQSGQVRTRPYDIPLRALIARDVDGLLMAGRCISGDFLAHGSYRMTGSAVAMGQAAGVTAAIAATTRVLPHEVPWEDVRSRLESIDAHAAAADRAPESSRV